MITKSNSMIRGLVNATYAPTEDRTRRERVEGVAATSMTNADYAESGTEGQDDDIAAAQTGTVLACR